VPRGGGGECARAFAPLTSPRHRSPSAAPLRGSRSTFRVRPTGRACFACARRLQAVGYRPGRTRRYRRAVTRPLFLPVARPVVLGRGIVSDRDPGGPDAIHEGGPVTDQELAQVVDRAVGRTYPRRGEARRAEILRWARRGWSDGMSGRDGDPCCWTDDDGSCGDNATDAAYWAGWNAVHGRASTWAHGN
jgi:hypothetical protein